MVRTKIIVELYVPELTISTVYAGPIYQLLLKNLLIADYD